MRAPPGAHAPPGALLPGLAEPLVRARLQTFTLHLNCSLKAAISIAEDGAEALRQKQDRLLAPAAYSWYVSKVTRICHHPAGQHVTAV